MLIENLDEDVEPVLDPLLGRVLIKKGKAIRLGDKEVEYNPNFHLYLHTKLANPHYKPELQAQTTLINFTVTRQGNIVGNSYCYQLDNIFTFVKSCPMGNYKCKLL